MVKVGDKVIVPMTEFDHAFSSKKVILEGVISRIDGAFYYIKIHNNPKYNVLELYESEFECLP